MIKKLLLLSTVTLCACNLSDDFKNLKTDIDTSLPFGYIELSDEDLLDKSSLGDKIYVGEDGVLTFKNNIELKMLDSDEIRDILDVKFDNINLDFNSVVGTLPIPPSGELPLDVVKSDIDVSFGDNVDVEKLTLDNGSIIFKNNTTLSELTCKVPQITKNGAPLVIATGQTVDLSDGWVITFDESRKLNLIYNGKYINTGGDASLNIDFTDIVIATAEGFFGNKNISTVNETVSMDENSLEFLDMIETLYLDNPYINININSGFDIPVGVIISKMLINDGDKDITVDLKKEFNKSTFLMNKGDNKFVINNASTATGKGLSEVINKSIRKVAISFDVVINPTAEQLYAQQGDIPVDAKNIFASDMSAKGDVDMVFPIDGYFKNLTYEDSFEINEDISDITVKDALFVITGANGMPIDLSIDLYAVRNDGREEKFNLAPISIKASDVNVPPTDPAFKEYIINESNYQMVSLNKDVLNNLGDYKSIDYKVNASTNNEDSKQIIKLYSGVKFKVNLNLGAKATIDL